MKLATLQALNQARRTRDPVALITGLDDGLERLVPLSELANDPLADELAQRLRQRRSGMVHYMGKRYFITLQLPAVRLVLIGAVHISQCLVSLARLVGYDVVIIDPRSGFATSGRFGDVSVINQWPDEALPELGIDRYTAFAALTHDPKIDDPSLLYALARQCFYTGALGSRKTHAARLERLRAAGAEENALACIRAPIGLDIGAVSPAEIAVSIMAEIVASIRLAEKAPASVPA